MIYRGRVKNGVVVLDPSVCLPEGTEVEINEVETAKIPETKGPIPTLYERYKDFIGIAEGLPSDMAENHDHYIHGTPKRTS